MTTQRRGRTSGSRRGFSRTRRQTEWENAITDPAVITAGLKGVVDLTSGYHAAERKGLTVARIIGAVRVNSADATLSVEFSMGITMETEQSVTQGATANPLSNSRTPWMWWLRWVALPAAGPSVPWMIDVRAQRKFVGSRDSLMFLIQNDDTTQSLEFSLGLRVLYKLA